MSEYPIDDIDYVTVSCLAGDTLVSFQTSGVTVQVCRLTPAAVAQLIRELERSREIPQTRDESAQ